MEVIRYLTEGEYRRVYRAWMRLGTPRGRSVHPKGQEPPRRCAVQKVFCDSALDGSEIAYARLKSTGWKMVKDAEHRFGDLTRDEETQLQGMLKGDNRKIF